MDAQLLEAFLAVAETGSFSAAAERILITQPAVSKRIAQLEAQLGARLFDRLGRTVHLTEAGRALLPRAERILLEMRAAREAIRDLSGRVAGSLRLAISHHIGLHRLPPVLKTFLRANPGVSPEIAFLDSEVACEGVLRGRYEVGVITLAPELPADIRARPVWPDPLAAMAAPDHPLAGRAAVAPAELAAHPAVLPGPQTYTGRLILERFASLGLPPPATMATNYLETIRMLAAVGLGWTVLPRAMAAGGLVVLPCPELELERALGYVHHRDRTLSNAARAFLALLDELAETQRPHNRRHTSGEREPSGSKGG
ncbi:MAG: transcriptional regulator [Porticoccaceae bacterium]|nr:MAG: transcriptional regulator [Porticoccaceae bacterium]